MTSQFFVSMAVRDLPKSKAFFEALGFGFNAKFSNDEGACLVINDTTFAMLVNLSLFEKFAEGKPICDARQSSEVALSYTVESRARVDELVAIAVSKGGKVHATPQDHGFMYQHGFEDLDGHVWEPTYFAPSAGQ